MSNKFKVIPKGLTAKEKYDSVNNNLLLKEGRDFFVTIKELEILVKNKPVTPAKIKELSDKEFQALPDSEKKLYIEKVRKYNSDLEAYHKKEKDYKTKLKPYENLNWAWRLAGLKLNPDEITHNESFSKGIQEIILAGQKKVTFPKLLEGGGIAWLEVWPEGQKATAKIGTGLCVQADGIPGIVRTKWTDFDYNPLDDVTVGFMSEVILHVYTTGMYGQDIEVHLIDRDLFDPNNELEISDSANPVADKKFFIRQVDILKIKEIDEEGKGVTDVLVKAEQSDPGKTIESEKYVQKIEIQVLIEKGWKDTDGDNLKIFPAIKSLKTGEYFKDFPRNYLNVGSTSQARQVVAEITNKAVMVGAIETNVANFLPCRFDTVKLDDTVVFDSGNIYHRGKNTLDIEVIAGKKELHLIDFAFRTKECEHKPEKHTNKELTIISVPPNFQLNIGPGADAKHPAKEKKSIEAKTTSSDKITYLKGVKTTTGKEHKQETGTIAVTQQQIQFDAFFNYDVDISSISRYVKIAKYFWLGSSFTKSNAILRFKAQANTCAFQKNINIAIYPDIKWSVAFGFNVKQGQLATLLPNWDQKKVVDRYTWDGNNFEKLKSKLDSDINEADKQKIKDKLERLEKQNKTNDGINDKVLDVTAKSYDVDLKEEKRRQEEKKEKEKNKPQKGKLSTLVEIMKDVEISVKAQIYGDTKLELTRDFIENTAALAKQYKDLYEKIKWAMAVLEGKYDTPKNQTDGDAKIKELLKESNRSKIKGLQEALTKSTQEVEILFPKFSIGANWQFEKVDGSKYPEYEGRSGLGYAVAFAADPLIGIEIKWHILDLLCRKHPIAYAVLAAVKALMAALGDNPNGIVVDFWVKGQISTDINFSGNALAGDKKVTAKGDVHITTGVEISITIEGKITSGQYTAAAKLGVGAKGEVGLGIIGNLGIDDKGIWMQSSLVFDGIKLTFEAVAGARVIKKRIKDDGTVEEVEMVGGESKIEIEVTMLDGTLESNKFYLN
ncbi:hypothetical protein NLG42_09215 [Flavobacterium plurextorum]|uniref:hypothetical protein n=1 Tax=Flavobacterium TaxID=237 RepID=UPI00214D4CDF|nr:MULTISPECIES: hypothetical protein [Flavobacterium]UUW10980.1 hypothetical protein NLG42_09215 [Flavobacterium plurextorum]